MSRTMTDRKKKRDLGRGLGVPPHTEDSGPVKPPSRKLKTGAAELLEALAALARELGDTRRDHEIVALFAETCRRIFPGRLFDIHLVEPDTGEVRQVYANRRLSSSARERLRLTLTALSEVDPSVLPRSDGHPLAVEVMDSYETVFERGVTGFDVAIHDHLCLYGGMRVEYERVPDPGELISDRSAVTLLVRLMSDSLRASRLLGETLRLKDYLEKALEGAAALMVVVDRQGVVTFLNSVFESLLNRSRSELIGTPVVELVPLLDRAKINALVTNAQRGGAKRSVEVRYPANDGGPECHVSFTARPISSVANEIDGVIVVGQDLTELRTLQTQIIHSEKLSTLGQVAAGVAHELNNPLTSITVSAEYLLRKLDGVIDSRDAMKLQRILESAGRIQGFTRDLVTYARPSGEEPTLVDIRNLVARAISFCEHVLARSKADITIDIAPDVSPVYGIRGQLEQVIVNLVTNACHALPPEGGKVRVEGFMATSERLRLCVIDTGLGIPSSDLAKVFDPFFTTKAEGQGTGLGLSIVRNILVNHGAEVHVESTVGQGTTFWVEMDVS